MAEVKDTDFVPGSAGTPDQPPAAEGVGERRPGSARDAGTRGGSEAGGGGGEAAGARAPATGLEGGVAQGQGKQPEPVEGEADLGDQGPRGTGGSDRH